ncbi:MAG: hypothetical protein NTZ19_00100 [Bacteroidetes bacterium]|nr:hypothetical protein [Bacteroidota bacterium]
MKKMLLLLFLIPLLGKAQIQPAKVINANRVFPKSGKALAFEKALASHVAKYHQSVWKWRVFSIETGPDQGGYQINEGPTTWDEFDHRGDLGPAHMQDWELNIGPLLQDYSKVLYAVYKEDLSTIAVANYTDKIAITHLTYNPGYSGETEELIKQLKPNWESTQRSTAVYEVASSGEPGYIIVTRYKDGLKERDPGYKASMKDAFEKNKPGSYQAYQDGLKKAVKGSWSEILSFQAVLSSK